MKFGKLSVLTLATASALAMAGQASAFAPTWPADGTPSATNVVVWHGGASASTASVQASVVGAFCDSAQAVDILEDARTLGKPAFWSVACLGKSTLPATLAGKKILWSKRDEGGSGVGVGPLALGTAVGFMKPSTGAGTNFTNRMIPLRTATTRRTGSSRRRKTRCSAVCNQHS